MIIILLTMLMLGGCARSVNPKHFDKTQQVVVPVKMPKKSDHLNKNNKPMVIPVIFLKKLKGLQPECQYFLKGSKPVMEKNITNCFERVLHEGPPKGLVSYMIKHTDFRILSKKTLGKLMELFALLRAREFKTISKLISLGAPTNHISIGLVADYGDQGEQLVVGNSRNCRTIELIITNNRKFYQSGGLYTGRIKTKVTDLHNLTSTFGQWYICPKAVKMLVKYNPRMRNIIDPVFGTPLRQLLSDFSKVDRNPELAKILMTKRNINLQDEVRYGGNTPLHLLLKYSATNNSSLKAKDRYTVRAMLDMGANIDIKNKDGITVRKLINERSDLKSLLYKP